MEVKKETLKEQNARHQREFKARQKAKDQDKYREQKRDQMRAYRAKRNELENQEKLKVEETEILEGLKTLDIQEQKIKKEKKKQISSTMKRVVWNTWIGEDVGKSKCLCCKITDITQMSFNTGHIIAEANGGKNIVSNMKPICENCNSSMGKTNMDDFMKLLI